MSNGSAGYTFLPRARRGLSAAISTADPGFPNLPGSTAAIAIDFHVNLDAVHVDASLYGPQHVIGIDDQQVVRTDPAPGAVDFEPNFLASIEFFDATLPWLFTPLGGSGSGGNPAPAPPLGLGRILEPDMALVRYDHEIPPEGLQVTRGYRYARWTDGSPHFWAGRTRGPGRGQGSSGLRFDLLERS